MQEYFSDMLKTVRVCCRQIIEGLTGISHSLATAPTIAQNKEILEVQLVGEGERGYIS
jgi:hypothetical protein